MQRITQKIIEPKLTKYVNTIKLEEATPRVTDSSNGKEDDHGVTYSSLDMELY